MPFPRTWIEELIVEWLHLDGYMVEANLPVSTPRAGGRGEADIVGARISNDVLQIRHIETGLLHQGEKSIEHVRKKFDPEIRKSLVKHFRRVFSLSSKNVQYTRVYIPTHWSKRVVHELRKAKIEVWPFPEFLHNSLMPTIVQWKENPPHSPKIRGPSVTLPESYWLLQMLDYMHKKGLLG